MKMRRLCAYIMALLLAVSMPLTALAEDWYLDEGNISVNASESGQTVSQGQQQDIPDSAPVISQSRPASGSSGNSGSGSSGSGGSGSSGNSGSGSSGSAESGSSGNTDAAPTGNPDSAPTDNSNSTPHTITINAAPGTTANVTLDGVKINAGGAAIQTSGGGNVTIELDGKNTVKSGSNHAGVEKNNSGKLTITDDNKTAGSLEATGGEGGGAGIGGGVGSNGSDITISGGTVNANGGTNAAGIGGGAKDDAINGGNGSNIIISGGTVTANGGEGGAGIGGGKGSNGSDITISGGTVNAKGGTDAAGIGGGSNGNGSNITISGSTTTATGGDARESSPDKVVGGGAGIGGGAYGEGNNIAVKYTAQVTATGKGNAADIGNGYASEATEKQKDKVDLSGLSSFGKVNGVSGSDGGYHASNGSSSSSASLTIGNKAPSIGGLTVSDNNGNSLSSALWLEEEGTLKVTAPSNNVLVTGNKADLLQLKEDGVKKINLQTNRVNVSVSNQVLDKITDSGGGFQLAADDTTVSLSSTGGNNQKTPGLKLTANKQPEKGKLQVDFLSEESKEGAGDVRESLNKTLQVSTNAPEATLSYNRKFLNALMNAEFGKLGLAVGNLLATVDGMLGAITTVNGSGSISIGDKSVIMDGLEFSAADSSENNKLDDVLKEIKLKMENKAQGGSVLVAEVDAKAAMASASLKVPGSALQSLMDQGVEETALSVNGETTSFKNSNLLKQIQDSQLDSAMVYHKPSANGKVDAGVGMFDKGAITYQFAD